MNDSDILAELENQFSPPQNRGQEAKPQPCRECQTEPALDPSCKECREKNGCCLLCLDCFARWEQLVTLGMMDLADRRELDTIYEACAGYSSCDVASILVTMTMRANIGQRDALNGEFTVSEWAQYHIRKLTDNRAENDL